MEQQAALPELSRRQMELLALRAQGLTNREIEKRCFICRQTVEKTLKAACEKMGTRSVMQAVTLAIAYEILILTGTGEVLVPERYNYLAA
jgi:DNA-binding NarL/FixJ family response regulator